VLLPYALLNTLLFRRALPSYVARLLLSACRPIVLVLPLLLLGVLLLFAAGHWPAAAWRWELRISGRGSATHSGE
jgi:hypothetical protein